MNPLGEPIDPIVPVNNSVWPIILKYGLIGSVIIILLNLISTQISLSIGNGRTSIILSFTLFLISLLIYMLIMIFSIRSYRDKYAEGYISLGRGMAVSYGSAMIMGVLNLLFMLLYFLVIDPGFMARANAASFEELGLDPSTIPVLPRISKLSIIFSQVTSFAGGCLIGGVLSLIISAIMKKERPFIRPDSRTFNT